jgi:hypothetical protein
MPMKENELKNFSSILKSLIYTLSVEMYIMHS